MAKPTPRWDWKRGEFRGASEKLFTSDVMERIAELLDINSKKKIAGIREEIVKAADQYQALKINDDNRPTSGQRRAALKTLLSQLEKLLSDIESLDEDSRTAIDLAATGSKSSLIYEVYLNNENDAPEAGEEITKLDVGHIYNLRDHVEAALDNLPQPRRGPQKKIAKTAFIWMLADIYKRHTGKRATVSSFEDGHRGRFVEFVEKCLEATGDSQSESGLGKRVRDDLKERRSIRGRKN